eukprot:7701_1
MTLSIIQLMTSYYIVYLFQTTRQHKLYIFAYTFQSKIIASFVTQLINYRFGIKKINDCQQHYIQLTANKLQTMEINKERLANFCKHMSIQTITINKVTIDHNLTTIITTKTIKIINIINEDVEETTKTTNIIKEGINQQDHITIKRITII